MCEFPPAEVPSDAGTKAADGCWNVRAASFITSAAEGMKPISGPALIPARARHCFPAAPGGVVSAVMRRGKRMRSEWEGLTLGKTCWEKCFCLNYCSIKEQVWERWGHEEAALWKNNNKGSRYAQLTDAKNTRDETKLTRKLEKCQISNKVFAFMCFGSLSFKFCCIFPIWFNYF